MNFSVYYQFSKLIKNIITDFARVLLACDSGDDSDLVIDCMLRVYDEPLNRQRIYMYSIHVYLRISHSVCCSSQLDRIRAHYSYMYNCTCKLLSYRLTWIS